MLTFIVDQVWKGPAAKQQVIYHSLSAESRVFGRAEKLVVFARELSGADRLRVGLPHEGQSAYGYMSFGCGTGMPVDVDTELARIPSTKRQ